MENSKRNAFRSFLKQKRLKAGLTIFEMQELSVKYSEQGKCLPFSAAYYCQVEKGTKKLERITFDLIWAAGVILGFDPVNIYIQSRKEIDQKYLDKKEKEVLFNNPVDNNKIYPTGYVVVLSNNPKRYLDFRGMDVEEKRRAKHYKGSKAGRGYAERALDRVKGFGWPDAYVEPHFSDPS
ncbi:MAG: hypothetical protein ACYDAI_12470 [Trichloromonadaceae bacterium]